MDHEDYRWAAYQVLKSKKGFEKSLLKAREAGKNPHLISNLEMSIQRALRIARHLTNVADKLEAAEHALHRSVERS